MTIPPPPPFPSRNDPENFSSRGEEYLQWLSNQAVPKMNELAVGLAVGTYTEGTFTPVVEGTTTAGVGTYVSQVGRFTRIGNRVLFDIQVEWTAHTGTGNIRIAGLPFTSVAGIRSISPVEAGNLTIPAGSTILGRISQSNSFLTLNIVPSGGGSMTPVAMDGSANVYISGAYSV